MRPRYCILIGIIVAVIGFFRFFSEFYQNMLDSPLGALFFSFVFYTPIEVLLWLISHDVAINSTIRLITKVFMVFSIIAIILSYILKYYS